MTRRIEITKYLVNKYFIDELSVFSINERLEFKVGMFGDNHKIVTIDNFYKNPDQVRDLALRIPPTFNDRLKTYLPGGRISAFYTMDHFAPSINNIIKDVWPEFWLQFPPNHIENVFRDATFVVNVMSSETLEPRTPHIDCPSPMAFAATIFLNTPKECAGGTAFYEYAGGMFDGDSRRTKQYINGSTKDWEMTYLAEMKYNRFILYQANVFHSAYITKEMFKNGLYRLNQMFFI